MIDNEARRKACIGKRLEVKKSTTCRLIPKTMAATNDEGRCNE